MDYIRKQIDQRIDFLQTMGDKNALKQHFQARFEYVLVYLLAYTFANVKLRTYKTKGSGTSKETLTMVFKMIQSAQKNWRRLRGFQKIVLVLNGVKFKDGGQ